MQATSGRQLSPVAVTTLQVTPHIRLRTVESNASSTSSHVQPTSSRPPNATTRPSRRLSSQPGTGRLPPNATTRPRRAFSQTASGQSHSDRGTPLYAGTARYSLHSPSYFHRSGSGSPNYPGVHSASGATISVPRSLHNVPETGYLGYNSRTGSRGPRSEGGSWHGMGEPSHSDAAAALATTNAWRAMPSIPSAAPTSSSALYSPVEPGAMEPGAVQPNGREDRTWFESWRGSSQGGGAGDRDG